MSTSEEGKIKESTKSRKNNRASNDLEEEATTYGFEAWEERFERQKVELVMLGLSGKRSVPKLPKGKREALEP